MRTKLWRLFQAIRVLVAREGPMVRIRLPPVASPMRTCLAKAGKTGWQSSAEDNGIVPGISTSGCNASIRRRAATQSGAYRWMFRGFPAFENTQITKSHSAPASTLRNNSARRRRFDHSEGSHCRSGSLQRARSASKRHRRLTFQAGSLIGLHLSITAAGLKCPRSASWALRPQPSG